MRGKKMTQVHCFKHDNLKEKRNKAVDAVFAAAHPRRDVVFSECLKLASPEVQEQYENACQILRDFEYSMVEERRAWIENGKINFYY